jgi:hypothetical protein
MMDWTTPQTITFVSADVPDALSIMTGLQSDVKVLLDPTKDAISQITESLAHYDSLKGVSIITHGNVAEVVTSNGSINESSLHASELELKQWSESLAPGADILFYGCNIAAGSAGQEFVDNISSIIGADVAASTDLTGSLS